MENNVLNIDTAVMARDIEERMKPLLAEIQANTDRRIREELDRLTSRAK